MNKRFLIAAGLAAAAPLALALPASAAKLDASDQGPVKVTLTAPIFGSSSGCASVSRELAKDISTEPSDYYVNVHNADFRAGAVRGQL